MVIPAIFALSFGDYSRGVVKSSRVALAFFRLGFCVPVRWLSRRCNGFLWQVKYWFGVMARVMAFSMVRNRSVKFSEAFYASILSFAGAHALGTTVAPRRLPET